jgi:type IV secretory pathway VirB3-like protein
MKKFEVYKNIRKQAVIFGLPISLFALMMVAILASLLVVIFSFSFTVIITVFIINAALYIALTRISNNPQLLQITKVFPNIISNKRNSGLGYEED